MQQREFTEHREEIDPFAAAVSCSMPSFTAMSYGELLEEWKKREHSAWLTAIYRHFQTGIM